MLGPGDEVLRVMDPLRPGQDLLPSHEHVIGVGILNNNNLYERTESSMIGLAPETY